MARALRLFVLLFLVAHTALVRAADSGYLSSLPTGDRWLSHMNQDLLPFWTMPAALGNPTGEFPSTRCDDGSLLNYKAPCPLPGGALPPDLRLRNRLPPDGRPQVSRVYENGNRLHPPARHRPERRN